MIRIITTAGFLWTMLAASVLPQFDWMNGCWIAHPADGVEMVQRWVWNGSGYQVTGAVIKGGQTVEQTTAAVRRSGVSYQMSVVVDSTPSSEWIATELTETRVKFKELAGEGRYLIIERGDNKVTITNYARGGDVINRFEYERSPEK